MSSKKLESLPTELRKVADQLIAAKFPESVVTGIDTGYYASTSVTSYWTPLTTSSTITYGGTTLTAKDLRFSYDQVMKEFKNKDWLYPAAPTKDQWNEVKFD